MSSVTPVSSIPAQNANSGAVTLTAKYGRLEVILDAAGATTVQLLVQGEGGDWMLEGSSVSVDSTRDSDGGKAVVYFPVRQPGSRYHAYCPNAPASYRAYISAAADASAVVATLSGDTSDFAAVVGTDGSFVAGATGRAADAGLIALWPLSLSAGRRRGRGGDGGPATGRRGERRWALPWRQR